jgi:hypothetical protein
MCPCTFLLYLSGDGCARSERFGSASEVWRIFFSGRSGRIRVLRGGTESGKVAEAFCFNFILE